MQNNIYIPASTPLATVIHSIWQVSRTATYHKEQIIPKGIVEIIFNFSDSFTIPALLGSKQYELTHCFINGFNKSPIGTLLPKQHTFFGVRFQPLAIKKIFKVPAGEFSDLPVDLTLLDKSLLSLWHQLGEQDSFEKRVAIVCAWIERKLFDWLPQETLINNFLCAIGQHDLSVSELANHLCYSPRHLSRKVFEATGMNTEEILLYKKYLHSVHLMHSTNLSLTEIAYQSHFSDQSHFIKSFKAYAKMTPGDYKRSMSRVTGHIYENVR